MLYVYIRPLVIVRNSVAHMRSNYIIHYRRRSRRIIFEDHLFDLIVVLFSSNFNVLMHSIYTKRNNLNVSTQSNIL